MTGVARLFLDQIGDRSYRLSIVDRQVPPILDPSGVLPAGCRLLPEEEWGLGAVAGFAFTCENPLSGNDALALPWNLAGVVVLARWSEGTEASAYFRGSGGRVEIGLDALRAGASSRTGLAGSFFLLGVEHILFGLDHLLFILGLLLLVRGLGPLVATITAFTLAHSLTLGAAVLGFIPVSAGPVEAAIALSIVLLAREVVMGNRGKRSLVHRLPWLVAFGFGLLHGLGFAGAVGEIGVRRAELLLALLSFNMGVEAGQLAFLALLVLLNHLVPGGARERIPKLEPVVGYALGALATFWFLGRLPAVFGG